MSAHNRRLHLIAAGATPPADPRRRVFLDADPSDKVRAEPCDIGRGRTANAAQVHLGEESASGFGWAGKRPPINT